MFTWTDDLIKRLQRYVEASRDYIVTYNGERVYGIEPARPEYGDAGWAGFYMSEGAQECGDTPHDFQDTMPNDFKVSAIGDIDWQKQ